MEIVTLGSIASIQMGYQCRASVHPKRMEPAHMVMPKHINAYHEIDWQAVRQDATHLIADTATSFHLKQGDVLFFSKSGAYYAALVAPNAETQGFPIVASSYLYKISTNTTQVLPEFLTWQLNQNDCIRFLKRSQQGSLTVSVRRHDLNQIPIALPAISQQQKIIKVYRAAQQQRKYHEQMIQNSQKLMAGLSQRLHRGKEV